MANMVDSVDMANKVDRVDMVIKVDTVDYVDKQYDPAQSLGLDKYSQPEKLPSYLLIIINVVNKINLGFGMTILIILITRAKLRPGKS